MAPERELPRPGQEMDLVSRALVLPSVALVPEVLETISMGVRS